jgi:hypothetical protein
MVRQIKDRDEVGHLTAGAKASLFASGVFAGGAFDHVLLAVKGSRRTPYGIGLGVKWNWAFAACDAVLAVAAYRLHRRLEWRRHPSSGRNFTSSL